MQYKIVLSTSDFGAELDSKVYTRRDERGIQGLGSMGCSKLIIKERWCPRVEVFGDSILMVQPGSVLIFLRTTDGLTIVFLGKLTGV